MHVWLWPYRETMSQGLGPGQCSLQGTRGVVEKGINSLHGFKGRKLVSKLLGANPGLRDTV